MSEKMRVNGKLDRTLVRLQANEGEAGHRWCKYREGVSAELMRYIVEQTTLTCPVLDPRPGSGTSHFVAAEMGSDAIGSELLPSIAEIIPVRRAVLRAHKTALAGGIRNAAEKRAWMKPGEERALSHLQITAGAFPLTTSSS